MTLLPLQKQPTTQTCPSLHGKMPVTEQGELDHRYHRARPPWTNVELLGHPSGDFAVATLGMGIRTVAKPNLAPLVRPILLVRLD